MLNLDFIFNSFYLIGEETKEEGGTRCGCERSDPLASQSTAVFSLLIAGLAAVVSLCIGLP